jgi:hypothetical protein
VAHGARAPASGIKSAVAANLGTLKQILEDREGL